MRPFGLGSLDLREQARRHVEDESSHRYLFGDPGVRSHLLDLLPGVLLRVLVGEEPHRAGDASPVSELSREFNSSSVKVVNPHPVWFNSMISVVPITRLDETSSPRTSSVTAGPAVRITSNSE
jgi:hypothetical protein